MQGWVLSMLKWDCYCRKRHKREVCLELKTEKFQANLHILLSLILFCLSQTGTKHI